MESSSNKTTSNNSDREFEEKLVLTVSQCECIYDKTSESYGCKMRNDSSWLKVARSVQRPIAECVDKWHFLFQIFLHFSRLEKKYGYEWCCSRWSLYESFQKIHTKLAQSYTELLTKKSVVQKSSSRESAERWLLIQEIETVKKELLERSTSFMRRQELWIDIAAGLNEKFPIPQRCVIGWQMVWWGIKQHLISLLGTEDQKFSKEHIRVLAVHGITSPANADAKAKLSMAYEFGENVSDSVCINCSSTTECELTDGLCSGCIDKRYGTNCQICSKNKGSCSLIITAWRDIARKLIPKSLRQKEAISICSQCHTSLKLRGARLWRACRFCGESNRPLENLMNGSYTRLKRIFHTAIGCTFSLADGLPCFICIKCHGEFVDFIRFYVAFSNTQAKLQKIHEKTLIGDEWSSQKKPVPADIEEPERQSKRQRSQTEIDFFFAANHKGFENNKSIYESALHADDSFDDTSQTPSEENTKVRAVDATNSTLPTDNQLAIKLSGPKSLYPVTLIKGSCKRTRRRSPVRQPVKTYTNPRKKSLLRETTCEGNAEQTSTISLRRKTDVTLEKLDDSDQTTSMDCDSNEVVNRRNPGRASLLSNSASIELQKEYNIADDTVLDPDYTFSAFGTSNDSSDSGDSVAAEKRKTKNITKQHRSQHNSGPDKSTSNTICKQSSSKRTLAELTEQEKLVRELELSNEVTLIVLDVETEPVKPPQQQVGKVQITELKDAESEQNKPRSETTTPTLPETTNKGNDVVSSGPSKTSDLDGNISQSEKISQIKLPEKSEMSSVKCKTERTTSLEESELSSSELSLTLTGSAEQSAIEDIKPSARVTRSSRIMTRAAERAVLTSSKPVTRANRSLGQPVVEDSKVGIRFTRSSLQSTMPTLKPITRVTRSLQQTAMADVKPTTPKRSKKNLGDLLMKCVLNEPVASAPAAEAKANLKTGEEPPKDTLTESIPDKPTIPAEAVEMDVDNGSIEVNKSQTSTQEVTENSVSANSSKTTSPAMDAILIGDDDSSSGGRSASHLRKESIETKSEHCMFLPDVVQSTEMRLHTDIALHSTLLPDDDDDYDIIEEVEGSQKQTTDIGHLQQSSLIDRVVERSYRTENSFLQITDVYSLNTNTSVDQEEQTEE